MKLDFTGMFEKIAGRSESVLIDKAIAAARRGGANKAFARRISAKAPHLTTGERNRLTHIFNRGEQLATAAENRINRINKPKDFFDSTRLDSILRHRKAKTTARDTIVDKADSLLSSGFSKKDLQYVK